MSIKAVYVEQYGAWWKLSPAQWRDLCKKGAEGYGHELPPAQQKNHRPKFIRSWNSNDGQPYYYSDRTDILIERPLDWEAESYKDALDVLREKMPRLFKE